MLLVPGADRLSGHSSWHDMPPSVIMVCEHDAHRLFDATVLHHEAFCKPTCCEAATSTQCIVTFLPHRPPPWSSPRSTLPRAGFALPRAALALPVPGVAAVHLLRELLHADVNPWHPFSVAVGPPRSARHEWPAGSPSSHLGRLSPRGPHGTPPFPPVDDDLPVHSTNFKRPTFCSASSLMPSSIWSLWFMIRLRDLSRVIRCCVRDSTSLRVIAPSRRLTPPPSWRRHSTLTAAQWWCGSHARTARPLLTVLDLLLSARVVHTGRLSSLLIAPAPLADWRVLLLTRIGEVLVAIG